MCCERSAVSRMLAQINDRSRANARVVVAAAATARTLCAGLRVSVAPPSARMPDFSFYRFERSVVFLLVVFVFYAYSPAPVERPLVDANGVLASFAAPTSVAGIERPFLFGLATAAAHVEDELNDSWLTFAQAGKVAAFANTPRPELRNAFWTSPETEIDLAASTGVKVRRRRRAAVARSAPHSPLSI